jgi:Flp pilus assembly protein TadG
MMPVVLIVKKVRKGERGSVMTLGTAAVVAVLLIVGLSVDLGTAYLSRARLYKAVDAAALAAARQASVDEAEMRQIALQVARANYSGSGVEYAVTVSAEEGDATRVTVTAECDSRTSFLRLAGMSNMRVRASGEATRFPLDMSLVLDVSYSLQASHAFDDMQQAAQAFLERFDENVDQVGIVSYSVVAREELPLDLYFLDDGLAVIDGLEPFVFANMDEGLRRGRGQLDTPPARTEAVKVLVLFSDGRPTAFRDLFDVVDPPDTYDGVIAAGRSGNGVAGLFDPVNGQKVLGFRRNGKAVLVPWWWIGGGSGLEDPTPNVLPGGLQVNGQNIREVGRLQAEAQASAARAAGHSVYCIGLGNVDAEDPDDAPDMDLLVRLANEHGVSDPSQPRGVALLAPTSSELEEVFDTMAERILLRLTR